jgi:hypothetical protein
VVLAAQQLLPRRHAVQCGGGAGASWAAFGARDPCRVQRYPWWVDWESSYNVPIFWACPS